MNVSIFLIPFFSEGGAVASVDIIEELSFSVDGGGADWEGASSSKDAVLCEEMDCEEICDKEDVLVTEFDAFSEC
jgi:hypothetical protein